MRARLAIAVSGVEIEHREVILREKPPEMLQVSPKGTVPVLVLPDGEVVEESLEIMRWALEQNDPENWLAHVSEDLVASNDGAFKHALDRYKYPHRYDLTDGSGHRDAALLHLLVLDQRLAKTPYLGGARQGFTDMALFPFVRQFAATDQPWFDAQPLAALQCWLAGIVRSELFMQIMIRHPQWKPTEQPALLT
jgi:glutathione S-transferase